ncbi:hypothetical protein WMY93_016779 [Mugilogobius chulae]|uniref:Uncharacterized protein n=1 Tax=Mugilogobius chulae TaxID=88201 RepID=A0AAW0NXB7_9GOBI
MTLSDGTPRLFLEPAIYHKWTTDQQLFLEELKKKDKIAVGGDMRADSPGHSAKFGSYTLMELESEKILDIQLVQSNEVEEASTWKKKVCDEAYPKVDKLSKDKECQLIKKWSAAIKNHMYWAASSSKNSVLIPKKSPETQASGFSQDMSPSWMRLVFNEVFAEPGRFVDQLKSVPVPEDLSAQHEKVSKDEVIAAHVSRFSRAVGGPDQGKKPNILPIRIRKLLAYPEYSA